MIVRFNIKNLHIQEAVNSTIPIPRPKNTEYWKELEKIPNRLRLAKEISGHFRDVSKYIPSEHRNRPSPLTQIHNAYNIKIDTTEYMNNRNYFSKLYRSMRMADITHQDILSIYGNPYIGIVTKWGDLSAQRKQNILREYPETDRIAGCINEAKQAMTLELATADYDTRQFIQDFVIVGVSVFVEKRFKIPNTLIAPVYATRMERAFAYIQPKYEKIAYKFSDRAGKLYKKAEDFFKKKLNTDVKPRLGTSGYKLGKHWTNLKPVNTPEMQRQIGKINKQAFGGGEVRTDGTYIYRFDPAHKTGKVHIEMYRKIKNNHWRAYAECDPKTGKTIAGSIEKLARKENIRDIKW